jgi:hypothetical protein
MHEFADEQSTALKFVFNAPSTFGVGGTVHAADAADGARSIAAVANKTRRDGRRDIWTATLRRAHAVVNPTSALSPSTWVSGSPRTVTEGPLAAWGVDARQAKEIGSVHPTVLAWKFSYLLLELVLRGAYRPFFP